MLDGNFSIITGKKTIGRARKRIIYNRRFVNVVATTGRRVGPNNNAARIAKEELEAAKLAEAGGATA